MCEPGATSIEVVKIRCYRHGHSGPEGIVDEARRSSPMWKEELEPKHNGRMGGEGGTYQEPPPASNTKYKQGKTE